MSNSDQDQNEQKPTQTGMGDHVQRYKEYLRNLKKGHSSGISAEFGSASTLVPEEFLEAANQILGKTSPRPDEEQETAKAFTAVEISKSQESEDLIPDSATIAGSSGATENNQTPSHRDATSNQSKVVALKEPTDQEISRIDVSGYGSSVISVETESGAWLYDICLEDGSIPSQIRLSDGELIQRACGSNRFVLSIPSGPGAFEYFILDWLVICPGTFNIYIATHEGGYNAFFLNNGWQIHQYQIADEQLNLVSEPATPGVTSRRTYQVVNLEIDLSGGTMAFQNPTNGATITLESRRL